MTENAIGWRSPEATPELTALIHDAREGRAALYAALADLDTGQMDALLRTLVVGDAAPACEPPLELDQPIDSLCEQALVARGPFDQGPVRTMLRERARMHLHLSRSTFALHTSQDLLTLWDEATRSEPIIREFIDEPRWRTAEDGVPFTGAKLAAIFGTKDLTPGDETADPASIPQLVEEVIAFASRQDLPPEIVAFGMSYLVFRIHPFKDGNGHTLRMLCCGLMHDAGYDEPTLLTYLDLLRGRHFEMCQLSRAVTLGKAATEEHIAFHLNVLLDAQREVLATLAKTRGGTPAPRI